MLTKERTNLLANYYLMTGDVYRARAYALCGPGLHDVALGPSVLKRLGAFMGLIKVLGAGPVTVRAWMRVGICNIADLRAREHRMQLTAMQRAGIKYYEEFQKRIPRALVARIGANIIEHLGAGDIAGSYRRGRPDSLDIDIVTTRPLSLLASHPKIEFITKGASKCMVLYHHGKSVICVDVVHCSEQEFVTTLFYLTGSGQFNVRIRAEAAARGYKLSEHGLFKGAKRIPIASERELFKILGMDYIAPQDRIAL